MTGEQGDHRVDSTLGIFDGHFNARNNIDVRSTEARRDKHSSLCKNIRLCRVQEAAETLSTGSRGRSILS